MLLALLGSLPSSPYEGNMPWGLAGQRWSHSGFCDGFLGLSSLPGLREVRGAVLLPRGLSRTVVFDSTMEQGSSKCSRLQTTGRPLATSAEKEFIERGGVGAKEVRQPGLCQVATGTVQPPQRFDPAIPSSRLPALQIISKRWPAPLSHSLGIKPPGGGVRLAAPGPPSCFLWVK